MKNAFTYITRACPRDCDYCNIKSGKKSRGRMSEEDWIDAFHILKSIGVTFNLILGNETWLLGDKLLTILKKNTIPFALYTTAQPKLFEKYREQFFGSGVIDNLTCGIDYSRDYLKDRTEPFTTTEQKAWDGWEALIWAKNHYPNLDMQGNITVYRENYLQLPRLVKELANLGIFEGVNLIHWNKDGQYDFFPDIDVMQKYLFRNSEIPLLHDTFHQVLSEYHLLHHPEVLDMDIPTLRFMLDMKWHCEGDPYGGPTIDSDGSLRCCGYRAGDLSQKLNILELTSKEKIKEWEHAVHTDTMNCPGCSWSFPRMFKHWNATDEPFGRDVFTKHAGHHVPEDKLPSRKVE